jgi:hypothetical protein
MKPLNRPERLRANLISEEIEVEPRRNCMGPGVDNGWGGKRDMVTDIEKRR